MTIETLYIADFTDILAIRLSCKKCGAAYSIPVSRTIQPPHSCRGCGFVWFGEGELNEIERAAFQELQNCLKALLIFTSASGVRLSFELPFPPSETRTSSELQRDAKKST